MRVLLLLVTLTCAAAASAQIASPPRVPQPSGPPPFIGRAGPSGPGSWREMQEVRDRIDDGRRSGQLSRREARGLRRQTHHVDGLADRYASDGLSEAETRELDVRARVLRDETIARRSGARRP